MNAKEARALSKQYKDIKLAQIMMRVNKAIKEAAQKGEFETDVGRLTHTEIEILEKRGYKVMDNTDPRDGYTTYLISWNGA